MHKVLTRFGLALLLLVLACGTTNEQTGAGAGGAGGMSGAGGGGGRPVDCDDNIACTLDTFVGDVCSHSVGPNSGATACPAGKYCTVKDGCVLAPACATDGDCTNVWSGDACKTNVACDHATGVCTFDVLDNDGDGFPPAACGGADCDDSDPARFPGNPETCDGKDNDCDGTVDDEVSCSDPLTACQAGACSCKPENTCGTRCVDKQTDPLNCGECSFKCAAGAVCTNGACGCPAGLTDCGGVCVDLQQNTSYCGSCTSGCRPADQACAGGECICADVSLVACGRACVDVTTDLSHCGDCNTACTGDLLCIGGQCVTGSACQLFISSRCGDCLGAHCATEAGSCAGESKFGECFYAFQTPLKSCMCDATMNPADCVTTFEAVDDVARTLGECLDANCATACGFN